MCSHPISRVLPMTGSTHSEIISLNLRRGKADHLPPLRFSMEVKEEQKQPPHHNDGAWGEPHTVCRLFSGPNDWCITAMMTWLPPCLSVGCKSHSFYKHLVKHEITKMRNILTHAQKYIQIKDATRSSANRSPKRGAKWRNKKRSLVFRRRL